jgi:hypothetical protein
MGCDIHCNLEYQRNAVSDWYDIDLYKKNIYFGTDLDEPEYWKVSLYNSRSYFLFGLLAGVRNRMVEPIKQPRGIPDDVCDSIRESFESWGLDAHTPSWYTLHELKRAQKTLDERVLQELIDAVELRFFQSENYGYKKTLTPDEENRIRLVFWFDN